MPKDAQVNPMPPLDTQDLHPDEVLLARFVIGAARSGGTMFQGRLYECHVYRLLGGDLAPRGTWPWDVRLEDETKLEIRSGQRSFKIQGNKDADVWIFVQKPESGDHREPPQRYFVASKETVEQLQTKRSSITTDVAEKQFTPATARSLRSAVRAASRGR